MNVAPLPIVSVPEPGSLTPVLGLLLFRLIWTLVPLAVLVPPSCSVRPPSSPKFVKVNAAPPCAIVVPEPLCVPPEKLDAPVTVSVPVPLSSPPDCVSPPVAHRAIEGRGAAGDRHQASADAAIDRRERRPLPANSAFPVMLDAASSVRVPPPNSIVPAPSYNAPTSVPPPLRLSVPTVTFTVPLLLNSVLIVEVVALPLLVNVP